MTASRLPVRTALETLRLEFPGYAITQQAIGGKMFYLAQAAAAHIQPRFAQAQTTERLRARLTIPLREFTVTEPSIPRVWDVLLGGKDNFAADRDQAAKLLSVFPRAAELARESRQFQRRAVAAVAQAGVRQFLDLGCGLPTTPATHEVAGEAHPGSVVVYADNDELVMSHARNLLARFPGVLAVAGDLTQPEEIVYDWRVRQVIDFGQPVAVVLAMVLHFFDAETARSISGRLMSSLAPGSHLIISTGRLDGQTGQQFTDNYGPGHLHHHTRDQVQTFLPGLELLDPGISEARAWRPPIAPTGAGRHGHIWAAVGRKNAPDQGPRS